MTTRSLREQFPKESVVRVHTRQGWVSGWDEDNGLLEIQFHKGIDPQKFSPTDVQILLAA